MLMRERYEDDSEAEEDVIQVSVRRHHTEDTKQMRNTRNEKWVKTKPSKQDRISADPVLVRHELRDYQLISPQEYTRITPGTYIRYIRYDQHNKPKLRLGGYLIKNGSPDYWVLRSGRGKRRVSWSVPLKGDSLRGRLANQYYRKKGVFPDEKVKYGTEVFEALASGRFMLIPTEVLEELTGDTLLKAEPKTQRHRRIILEGATDSENEEDNEPTRQKIVARFRDDSSDTDTEEW